MCLRRNTFVFCKSCNSLFFIFTILLQMKVDFGNKIIKWIKDSFNIFERMYKSLLKEAKDYVEMTQDITNLMLARGFLIEAQSAKFGYFIMKLRNSMKRNTNPLSYEGPSFTPWDRFFGCYNRASWFQMKLKFLMFIPWCFL